MKTQLLQENFSKALSQCSRFVSSRAQLPVLSNVLLKTNKTKLQISATNLEISISTSIGAKIESEGQITVPAKTIADIISNLHKGPLTISSEREELIIESENFSANLMGLSATEFPNIPDSIGSKTISFNQKEFARSLSEVVFSASSDESRPVLTGVLFLLENKVLSLVGTDGFRLSKKQIALENKDEIKPAKIIVPKSALGELLRTSDSDIVSIEIKEDENQILFGNADTVLTSRVIEGEFPNFERIIPKESRVNVRVDREEFLRAIKLACVVARDAGYVGKLNVSKEGLSLSTESSKSGSQKAFVEAKVEGDGVEILYNLRFIEDFLNIVGGEEISIGLTDSTAPGVFGDPKDPDFLHLIMPVKTQ